MQTHLNDHRSDFEKKWENMIAQLEAGSKDGVISMAEFRIRTEVQKKCGQELEGSDGE